MSFLIQSYSYFKNHGSVTATICAANSTWNLFKILDCFDFRRSIVSKYENGCSVADLAKEYRITRYLVLYVLKEYYEKECAEVTENEVISYLSDSSVLSSSGQLCLGIAKLIPK